MIKARVIRIISSKQLIFNAGSADGVQRGMKFRVQSSSEPIIDPQTGEKLGEYPTWKVTIEPDRVFERYTIASQPLGDDVPDFEVDSSWPDLPVDPASIQPLRPTQSRIVVGDIIEQIPGSP